MRRSFVAAIATSFLVLPPVWSDGARAGAADGGSPTPVPIIGEYRHGGIVEGALFSADETRILSWSRDGTLKLWDVATGEQVGLTMTHGRDGWVRGAMLTTSRIVSWSSWLSENAVRIWDPATGGQIGPGMNRKQGAKGVLLNPTETRILSWSSRSLVLWDVATGRQIGSEMNHNGDVVGARISRDEKRILL